MTDRKRFATVWEAIEDDPEQAANLRLRSELMLALKQEVTGWKVTQATAARRLGISQPRLNDLLRGRIDKFSLDALVALARRAGFGVRIELSPAA